MTAHPRSSGGIVALALAVAALSACGTSASRGREGGICNDADKAVVSDIMSTARTNFKDGDSVTDHIEFVKAATRPIPESKRKYGAAELMVLLVSVYIQDADVPTKLQGVQGPVYVVLDADGKPLAPLGTFSQPFFDIQPPADPGWTAWADGIDDSDVAYDLFGCVNPNSR
ncbi:hypothetical protein [Aeromicrobium fastidiosum]|uniref:Lipoprotein n=1 Tax=Aeromicrobium fastidiosum TaxID=52699 RepID=A0A641AR02_9ACTN|nr:hypothetical protein [Aeromicrobium fastidiosum]KAA1380536.1 hypothetical protein ESP62_004990 [Aeromicrobium fastidiosum]MBP2390129.1 hypothetical protein [Aeromicrobium fastidiosum]